MSKLWFASLLLIAVCGCGGSGSGSSTTVSAFAGTWSGTYTNVADATDTGTSHWTIKANGNIEGTDVDPVAHVTYATVGSIAADGTVTATSTPTGGASVPLSGTLTMTATGLGGNLVWAATPPLTYTYALKK